MQTNVPDVYASGDVAEAYDFILNQNRLLPLWPLAIQEGKIAGYNMAGQENQLHRRNQHEQPQILRHTHRFHRLSQPQRRPALEVLVKARFERKVYKKLVLKDNVIVGMTLVGDIERAGILFYLMKNNINVKKFKEQLLADDFGLATLAC